MENKLLKENKKRHRKQASQKQLTAFQLRAQGLSPTEAARKAGYSEATINTPKQIFTSQALVTAVDKFKLELKDKDLTTDYMAAKIKEWMEAQTIIRDKQGNVHYQSDYQTQQNAYKFLKEILIDQEIKEKQPIKKTLTLTEYLTPQNIQSTDSNPIQELSPSETPHIIDTIESNLSYKEEKEQDKILEELII